MEFSAQTAGYGSPFVIIGICEPGNGNSDRSAL